MNPADVTEWLVDKKKRGWRRRFRRRKTAHQPPTTQSQEKRGPKKMAEEWEKSAVWPSSETPPRAAHADETPLRFSCSLCRDARQYSPKDLVGHFEDRHAGIPPVFSCQMCAFSAHQFSYLQVHLLSHRDTFSSCAVCEDHVQRTWSEFRAHLTAQHCRDGQYSCAICRKFSTGDVGLFLEHAYAHHLTVDGRKAEADRFVLGAAAQTLRCQHCGYEVSRKLLINDDIHAVHICSGRNLARAKTGAPAPGAAKPDRSSPRVKLRLTRSAVREMCWLTQDCLSLPGREFLDKYCHLSDPHATLEETQEFLMQSVAGETADPKWTEALKSVLSNVPQGINLHPMSDHGKGSDSSDLAVLTVKNKITVAPNGAAYCKRLKSVTSAGKEPVPAGAVAHEGPAQNGRQSDFSNSGSSPRVGTRRGGGASGQSAPPERTQTPEDRKDGEDGSRMSSGLKLASERQATAPRRQRRRRRNVRRKGRAVRRKSAQKKAAGLPLKLLLKKNPVRGKQWVTQSCEGAPDARPGPEATPEETPRLLHHAMVAESCQRKGTKDSAERPGAEAGPQQTEPRAAEAGPSVRDPRQGGAEAELGSEVPPLRGPGGGVDPPDQRSAAADGGAAAGSSAEAAPPEPVITLQGETQNYSLHVNSPADFSRFPAYRCFQEFSVLLQNPEKRRRFWRCVAAYLQV